VVPHLVAPTRATGHRLVDPTPAIHRREVTHMEDIVIRKLDTIETTSSSGGNS
jgi:hypothetical protein